MIKKSNELDFSNKNYVMLITGRPGVGKTTLAESAPDPILIDLESGVDRVEACYRGDVSVVEDEINESQKYDAFLKDLESPEVAKYKTIIIDSLGKLIELMTPVVIKENAVNAQKDGKTLSQKGYGAIKLKCKEFFRFVKNLHKNVIIIAHVSEFKDGDVTKTRINAEGSVKDWIWDDVAIGGYMEFVGKERKIHFSPSEKWDAKGSHGIEGDYDIPLLKPTRGGGSNKDNHFITDLFNVMNETLKAEKESYDNGKELYEEVMKLAPIVESAKNADELNEVVEKIKAAKHGLTSKKELLSKVQKKATELNLTYDKESKRYIANA